MPMQHTQTARTLSSQGRACNLLRQARSLLVSRLTNNYPNCKRAKHLSMLNVKRSPAKPLRAERLTLSITAYGGADRDRTGDPLLAKQVLSQLSYSP